MNDRRLDLRLLFVFDALMTERSATRAAHRIGASQPTVSTALNHLRDLFGDELFIRAGNGLQPTDRARELADPVRQALAKVSAVFNMRNFDPSSDERVFSFAMSEHGIFLILPKLAADLEKHAPNIQVRVVPKYNPSVGELLNDDQIDFVIGFVPNAPDHLYKRTLFSDTYVGVMREGHPLNRPDLTTQEFICARHVLVTTAGAVNDLIDRYLPSGRSERRTSITVDNLLSASLLVANSNYVSIMFRRLVDNLTQDGHVRLKTRELPIPEVPIDLLWHPRYNKSQAHEWMRHTIAKALKEDDP